MYVSLMILILTCALIILSVLVKPSIKIGGVTLGTYWLSALLGASLMLIFGVIDFNLVWQGLTSNTAVNPIKILVLFISMTLLSVFLDETGFFSYLAEKILHKAKTGQKTLFFTLYITVSILTVFTSNDIIILTFTPFICFFCKRAKIDPVPYLFTEFVAANTWSMALIIGNPTNIYLASNFGISFFDYLSIMVLPTVCGGLTSLLILYLLFKKTLSKPIQTSEFELKHQIKDKFLLVLGLIHLLGCIILLAISSYINLEMWMICLSLAVSESVIALVYLIVKKQKKHFLFATFRRAPYELIPFVVSMFIVVLGVTKSGVTDKIITVLSGIEPVFSYGIASYLTANLINNIPMSVLFANLSVGSGTGAVFASIVGSNLGALLTPIGALAGIMWCNLLKIHDLRFSFNKFIKYGVLVSVPTLIVTLCILFVIL